MRSSRNVAGFSIMELLVVVAIIAIGAAMAVPATSQFLSNQRLVTTARSVGSALAYARGRAIKTGDVHIAFFGTDAAGSSLSDLNGDPVDILILNDGRPGDINQNCAINTGEEILTMTFENGVDIGRSQGGPAVPNDNGAGTLSTGSTFENATAGDANWVMFRPEGTPRAFSNGCAIGALGTGSGGIYLSNGARDMAVILTPLGSNRVHRYSASGTWTE